MQSNSEYQNQLLSARLIFKSTIVPLSHGTDVRQWDNGTSFTLIYDIAFTAD